MDDLELARHIAAKYHAGQKYGNEPYTYHLQAVEAAVKSFFPGDERLRVVAQLHDILEDTAMSLETLTALFEKDVVNAVIALTKMEFDSREQYLAGVRSNELARKVKIADAFCNLQESLQRGHMRRIKKYGETLAVLAT